MKCRCDGDRREQIEKQSLQTHDWCLFFPEGTALRGPRYAAGSPPAFMLLCNPRADHRPDRFIARYDRSPIR